MPTGKTSTYMQCLLQSLYTHGSTCHIYGSSSTKLPRRQLLGLPISLTYLFPNLRNIDILYKNRIIIMSIMITTVSAVTAQEKQNQGMKRCYIVPTN